MPIHLETTIMLVAVWWVWMYTTWVTNWMDPETGPVRGMLIVLMLLGLILSTSIPEAFGDRALGFACAYVAMQLGRTLFVAYAYAAVSRANAINLLRIAIWFAASAPLWIVGAVLGGQAQVWLWLAAILIELSGPALRYVTPVLGASRVESWNISGEHMAERSGLFIIIAFGESILVTGTAFSDGELSAVTISAFLAAFAGAILLWLLYFSHGADGGRRFIGDAEERGPVARLSYVYLHIPIVAGIVVVAVGDYLVLGHPTGALDVSQAVTITGGPTIYLAGLVLFKRSVGIPWPWSHMVGIAVIGVVFAIAMSGAAPAVDALMLTWITNAILVVLVLFEERGFRSRQADDTSQSPAPNTLEP